MESEDEDPLKAWRQGDFAQSVGGFSYATDPDDEFPYSLAEEAEGVWGLIVVSQTCDVVLETAGRQLVSVCPLVERSAEQIRNARSGRNPSLIEVDGAPENIFADLSRVMSVSKSLLRTWSRQEGFRSDQGRRNFAASLERKFGRFAFPDDFDASIKRFRDRVWQRHDKTGSDIGKVYRSIAEIRFAALPDWEADQKQIRMLAVLHNEDVREIGVGEICNELETELGKVELPDTYTWDEPKFLAAEPGDLTGEDILLSDRADFDFLCR